ncbi:MAG: hypothetical protein KF770_05240 [Anaerolineae bacterium]|nr:hypothetical protein [Anaerolineae bacterium]
MAELLDPTDLEELTRHYWQTKDKSSNDSWDEYLICAESDREKKDYSLLAYEMAYADSRRNTQDKTKRYLPPLYSNTTLVILVGETWEPIFQSIWAHNPQRLVPVVNKQYPNRSKNLNHCSGALVDGNDYWNGISDMLQKLLRLPPRGEAWKLLDRLPTVTLNSNQAANNYQPVEDEPEQVFSFLQTHLRTDLLNPDCQVVVDITGAKKTMVAGAFMLAAYSHAQICYVDTDRHYTGRPYGYSCHFRTVSNPIKALALQTWDKVGKLYDQYDFAGALNLLPDHETFPQIADLRCFLSMCQDWESRQLQSAWESADKLPDHLKRYIPLAVKELHQYMPQSGETALKPDLFADAPTVVIYAYDELYRVQRLKSMRGAYRDAFSRAYAIYETLFTARLVSLFRNCELDTSSLNTHLQSSDENWQSIVMTLLIKMQSYKAREILQGRKAKTRDGRYQIETKWNRQSGSPGFLPLELSPKELKDKRNDITHSYMPVTKDDVNDIIRLTLLNFDNYLKEWATPSNLEGLERETYYQLPNWKQLREICNLHFIPVQAGEGGQRE